MHGRRRRNRLVWQQVAQDISRVGDTRDDRHKHQRTKIIRVQEIQSKQTQNKPMLEQPTYNRESAIKEAIQDLGDKNGENIMELFNSQAILGCISVE